MPLGMISSTLSDSPRPVHAFPSDTITMDTGLADLSQLSAKRLGLGRFRWTNKRWRSKKLSSGLPAFSLAAPDPDSIGGKTRELQGTRKRAGARLMSETLSRQLVPSGGAEKGEGQEKRAESPLCRTLGFPESEECPQFLEGSGKNLPGPTTQPPDRNTPSLYLFGGAIGR